MLSGGKRDIFELKPTKLQRGILVISLLMFSAAGAVLTSTSRAAGNATLSLTPESQSVQINNNFTITLSGASGAQVLDTMQADVRFDAAKISYQGISYSGPFSGSAEETVSSGRIVLGRYIPAGQTTSGNFSVAILTFKALTGSGSSQVTVYQANSYLIRAGVDYLGIVNGSSVTFTTPVATCAAGQTGTPPNCVTPSTSNSSPNTTPSSTTSNPSSNTTPSSTPTNKTPEDVAKEAETTPAAEVEQDTATASREEELKSIKANKNKRTIVIAGTLAGLGLLGIVAWLFIRRRGIHSLKLASVTVAEPPAVTPPANAMPYAVIHPNVSEAPKPAGESQATRKNNP